MAALPKSSPLSRVPIAVTEAPGFFVAGDWVGDEGWLAGASLASGEKAGVLAEQTGARQ